MSKHPDLSLIPIWEHSVDITGRLVSWTTGLASLSVIITGCMFYKRLVVNKIYMKLILSTSISEFMASFPGTWGYIGQDSGLCASQGFLMMFFFRASWMFTTALLYTLYSQFAKGKIPLRYRHIVFTVALSSTILSMVPLFGGLNYGGCFRSRYASLHLSKISDLGKSDAADQYNFDAYYLGIMYLPLAAMVLLQLSIIWSLYYQIIPIWLGNSSNSSSSDSSSTTTTSVKKLNKCVGNVVLYPVIMVVNWLPYTATFLVCDMNNLACGPYWYPIGRVCFQWGMLNGTFLALIFFYKSSESRMLWRKWWQQKCGADDTTKSGTNSSPRVQSHSTRGSRMDQAREEKITVDGNAGDAERDTESEWDSDFSEDDESVDSGVTVGGDRGRSLASKDAEKRLPASAEVL